MLYFYQDRLKYEDESVLFPIQDFKLNRPLDVFKEDGEYFNLYKEMILDIDKTELIKDQLLISPVLGAISPNDLSGGVKGLVMLLVSNKRGVKRRSKFFGDNCFYWLIYISNYVDVHIVLDSNFYIDKVPEHFHIKMEYEEGKFHDYIDVSPKDVMLGLYRDVIPYGSSDEWFIEREIPIPEKR